MHDPLGAEVQWSRSSTTTRGADARKYHCAPSDADPDYCRPSMELPIAGRPEGDESQVEEEETDEDEE